MGGVGQGLHVTEAQEIVDVSLHCLAGQVHALRDHGHGCVAPFDKDFDDGPHPNGPALGTHPVPDHPCGVEDERTKLAEDVVDHFAAG